MSIIGTINGANIIALPAIPAFKDLKLTQNNTVGVSTNPWTKQQQVYDYMAGYWTAEVTLPPMTVQQARAWFAFFSELKGQTNVFSFGDSVCAFPGGTPRVTAMSGGVFVNGSGQAGYTLNVKGFIPHSPNVFVAGDYIQVGYRLHVVTETISADGSGNASLSVWPQLRSQDTTLIDGEQIITHHTTGLWRLSSNSNSWSVTEFRHYGITFSCVEAL